MGLIEHMSRNPLGLALSPAIMMRNLVWHHFSPSADQYAHGLKKGTQRFNCQVKGTSIFPNITEAVVQLRTKTITRSIALVRSSRQT